ncbi:tRNA methyltransferas-like protein [Stipitochalara longipes BDJ]|nr:tRNA methyltransferas-like protein [Stipitochalara longipes BDJ]
MSPQMPYQCMVQCGNLLIAARGSSIDVFEDSSLLSTWKCPSMQAVGKALHLTEVTTKLATQNSQSSSVGITIDSSSPPAKKRKLSASEPTESKPVSKEGKKKQNNRSDAVQSGLEAPAVIALAVTRDHHHVIAVTGEDKNIRVFEIAQEDAVFQLKQLSQRAMPKRPCALTVTDDGSTIISADKFGDVYALPLIVLETSQALDSEICTPEPTVKAFTPAANELTIHSQRNLKALENQRRQTNKTAEKSEPSFEHKLLLGHVSMLTDITLVELRGRSYIITADRDEHIRISRGMPQTHIIEGFCLGHSEFVSRICVPAGKPQFLVSGGGDDELFVWEWESGTLISKTDLKKHVSAVMQGLDNGVESGRGPEPLKIAASGVYCTKQVLHDSLQDIIVVTCEGIPALFTFVLTEENHLEYIQTMKLSGNALAVVVDTSISNDQSDSSKRLLVSIDTIHTPGSTTKERENAGTSLNPLQSYKFKDGRLVQDESFQLGIAGRDDGEVSGSGASGRLTNLLYSLENLRKREGEGQEE